MRTRLFSPYRDKWGSGKPGSGPYWFWAVLCLVAPISQAAPTTIASTALFISDPAQTRGLTVVQFELPIAALQTNPAAEWVCLNAEVATSNVQWLVTDPHCWQPQQQSAETVITGYALLRDSQPSQITISSHDSEQTVGTSLQLSLDPAQARPGSADLLQAWAEARNAWFRAQQYMYFATDRSSRREPEPPDTQNLFAHWQTIAAHSYGVQSPDALSGARQPRPGDTLNAFSLFSGEAAIQETLQQQLLTVSDSQNAVLDHSIDILQGPDVPSHPFEALLDGRAGGELEIARLVPAERWFVHISQPAKALDWLRTLSESSAQLAGLSTRSYVDQALLERYLGQLKLTPEFVQRLGPLAKQAAVFGPDLYVQHGSHISLIAEVPSAPALHTLLKLMLGIRGERGVQAYGQGTPAYFAQHQQWLIFSTSRAEAEQALQLAQNQTQNSLGASAEFRYMLEQLAPAASGLYVYLSDPFIRAMTGPRIKIAQLRRQKARARLELVTAAALLYEADYGKPPALDELIAQGFVAPGWLQTVAGDQISLDKQGRAQSARYGTLALMTPLSELDIDAISAQEAEGYQAYVDEYSRFWRTTFDPIGVRIEVADTVRVETLILPLINNSIYDAVRAMIDEEAGPLALPAMTPAPVTSLGFRLPEAVLQDLTRNLFSYRHREQIPDLSKALTGQVHIALYDDEPIIAFGSADLMGAFSGAFMRQMGRGRGGIFLYGGMLASLLTQPTAIFVELRDGTEVESWAQRLFALLDWNFGERVLQPYGDSGWVYTYTIENLVRFHLYLRQEGNYLIISNRSMPLVPAENGSAPVQANAALSVNFSQIQQLAPTLHLHAMQALPGAWRRTIGQLAPLRWLGMDDPAAAQATFQQLYGYRPELPSYSPWPWPDAASWQNLGQNLLPEFKLPSYHELAPEQRRIGPFQDLNRLQISFKLVDEGVRVVLELMPR